MRKILAYSGGYDSTYTLIRLLEEADEDDEIIAVSLVHYLTGEAKLHREHESQIITIDKLRSIFKNRKFTHLEIAISIPWEVGSVRNVRGLSQPVFWISNIIPLIENGDAVYLGYIQDDQAMTHLHDIHQMWDAALAINGNKDVKLLLPNQYLPKTDVIKYLLQKYPEVFDSCVSCESVNYNSRSKVCGECVPCQHTKMTLMSLAINNYGSVRDKAIAILRDKYNIGFEVHDLNDNRTLRVTEPAESTAIEEDTSDESNNIER